jgi:nickel/cobalt exporter
MRITEFLSFANPSLNHDFIGKPLAIALLLAFLYGCFHVVGPGNGKSVIVGYFLSQNAKLYHAVWLGTSIAASHVASALVALVALAVICQHSGTSLENSRIIRLTTYGSIVSLGCFLLVRALGPQHDSDHHCTDPDDRDAPRTFASGAVACIVGAIPCTGSLLVVTMAVANGTYFAGTLLLLAIGAGIATAMTGIGLLTIAARRRFALDRMREGPRSLASRMLSLAGPALIIIVGAFLFITTLHSPANY